SRPQRDARSTRTDVSAVDDDVVEPDRDAPLFLCNARWIDEGDASGRRKPQPAVAVSCRPWFTVQSRRGEEAVCGVVQLITNAVVARRFEPIELALGKADDTGTQGEPHIALAIVDDCRHHLTGKPMSPIHRDEPA